MSDLQIQKEEERLQTEYVLRTAVFKSFEKDVESFDAVGEAIPDSALQEKMNQAFARGVRLGISSNAKRAKKNPWIKRISIAAALLLVILIPSGLYANASTRSLLANFLIHNFSQFSTIQYGSGDMVSRPIGWELPYYPLLVPESFGYERINLSTKSNTIWYSAPSGKTFSFAVYLPSASFRFDTENMEVRNIETDSYTATLYLSSDGIENMLVIYLPDYFLIIRGNLTEEEILRVGNSINGL